MNFERMHLARTSDPIALREVPVVDDEKQCGAYKPVGFWYEVDGDWRRWCEAESFGIDAGFLHRVELNDCNMLFVDTLRKLDEFHRAFTMSRPLSPEYSLIQIDWCRVAEQYDGIEIAPYQRERRFAHDFMWYYGWDCASGVIWRPKNARVTYVQEYRRPEVIV